MAAVVAAAVADAAPVPFRMDPPLTRPPPTLSVFLSFLSPRSPAPSLRPRALGSPACPPPTPTPPTPPSEVVPEVGAEPEEEEEGSAVEVEEVEGRVVCGRTAAAAAPVVEVRASCEDEDEDEDGEVKGPHVAQLPRFFISVSQPVSRARRAVSRRSSSASRCSINSVYTWGTQLNQFLHLRASGCSAAMHTDKQQGYSRGWSR